MTLNNLDTLEDRIQEPGYILLLVVVFLLLVVGLVDLIDYIAEEPIILGRYPIRYFVVMVGYTIFTIIWGALLLKPNDNHILVGALDYIQTRPVLAIGALVLMAMAILVMGNAENTIEGAISTLPAFQFVVVTLSLLFSGIILFYKWGDESRPQRWRKIIVAGLGILLVIEIILQLSTFFGIFPVDLTTTDSYDHYSPYKRIYNTEEGLGHGLTNNFGRYAPVFELLPDSHRIVVLGDSFVEGIQVSKDQNFSTLIEEQLAADIAQEEINEVLSLGHPDLGPGMYLSEWMLTSMITQFDPDEAIIFFDFGNDFQTVESAGTGYPYFIYEGEGKAQIDKTKLYIDLHRTEHYVYRGYKGIQPVLILKSNYLTPRLAQKIWTDLTGEANKSENKANKNTNFEIDLPNGFVFNEQSNEIAIGIAGAQIKMAKDELDGAGIDVKLVTNPTFSDAFYEQEEWNTAFGNSDLLLPERELRQTAAQYGIPFLGLGAYMESQGMSPADVQELYFDEGRGHFTPAGHEFVAEAIYQCFFAKTLQPEDGCDLR